jgi:ribosome-associated toxin RatA of RatAB toxin-antitoxin module
MKKTVVNKTIAVPASDAWEIISDPVGLENYFPAVSSSEVVYRRGVPVRKVILLDGSHYEEVFNRIDYENRKVNYSIIDPSPLPYSKLKGCITIKPVDEDTCEVRWACCYDTGNGAAEDIDMMLTLVISFAIKGIERFFVRKMAYA